MGRQGIGIELHGSELRLRGNAVQLRLRRRAALPLVLTLQGL
jgi:hypothetical protein